MSHFTKLATKLIDEEFVRSALVRMGYEPLPVGKGVAGWQGKRTQADFKVSPAGARHEIGFVRTPTGYEVVADWYGMSIDRNLFTTQLSREYAIDATKMTLARDGYSLAEETVAENGTIRLVLTRQTGM